MREPALFAGIGLLSVLTGWPLAQRRVPPNRWYGFRTPTTFANRDIWYEVNALCGRDLMLLGLVLVLVALTLPRLVPPTHPAYAVGCSLVLLAGSVLSLVRGLRLAGRLRRERRGGVDTRHGEP